jgi:sarcosine oxidase, subunit gamma
MLVLIDLTASPRLGFKGRGTMEAMASRKIAFEPEANRAFRQADGGLCLILARSEVILLGAPGSDGAAFAKLEAEWSIADLERSYPVPRRDGGCWLRLTGDVAPLMFAKICGVDLRLKSFPDLAIAQTSVARLNGVICRDDLGERPSYHLLADIASKDYLVECLVDAMAEFGGQFRTLADLDKAA